MLRYKVTPPPLPRCVERPRLLEQVLPAPVVVLASGDPGFFGIVRALRRAVDDPERLAGPAP